MPRFHAASNKRGVVHLTPMTVGQGLLFLRSPRNILYRRQVHAGQLHGDRKPLQRQGMTTFTQLTSAPSHPAEPFTDQLRLAVAAYLARFKGSSREHTESDLRCYLALCAERGLDPLAAQRPHLELYIRWMQEIRRFKPSTVSRRFSVAAGFYRTCVLDGVLQHSPAEHVRRPVVPAESPTLGFTHLQFEALLTAARQSANPCDFALAACSACSACGSSRPPAPTSARNTATGSCGCAARAPRSSWCRCPCGRPGHRPGGWGPSRGPVLLNRRGARMDRHTATRRLRRLAGTAGIQAARAHPHILRHTFVTTIQGPGVASNAAFREKRKHPRPALQLPRPSQRAGGSASQAAMTCAAITGLHQTGRCCSHFCRIQ